MGQAVKRTIAAIFLVVFGMYGLLTGHVLGVIPILIAVSLSLDPDK